jgi:hypothetical protein
MTWEYQIDIPMTSNATWEDVASFCFIPNDLHNRWKIFDVKFTPLSDTIAFGVPCRSTIISRNASAVVIAV